MKTLKAKGKGDRNDDGGGPYLYCIKMLTLACFCMARGEKKLEWDCVRKGKKIESFKRYICKEMHL